MSEALTGSAPCECRGAHVPKFVAVTGGPGAGKTAVLAVARRHFCAHVVVLPEAATIVYGGGFPRLDGLAARRHAQVAILHVQDQMEQIERDTRRAGLVLCDRGVLDGLAYWDGDPHDYYRELGESREALLERYAAVLHLRPATADHGYSHENPLRIESPAEAARLDARIEEAWAGHPSREFVASTDDFVAKIGETMACLERFVPVCCRRS